MALIVELEGGILASPAGLDAAVQDFVAITLMVSAWRRRQYFPIHPIGFDNVVSDVRRSGAWHRQHKGIP
ncbi:MAG: hypothetical protein JNJ62_01010 [Pseudoxanthomonas mexicana]|nr:hypothetical protein [Pseudoxanthomonas mexicana]